MKIKLLSAIIILSAATAMMCGCNEGQTGGQHLNDGPDARIVEQDGDAPGADVLPSLPDNEGETEPPRPPKGWRKPKRIFGERRRHRCPDCPDCPEAPGTETPEAPENGN